MALAHALQGVARSVGQLLPAVSQRLCNHVGGSTPQQWRSASSHAENTNTFLREVGLVLYGACVETGALGHGSMASQTQPTRVKGRTTLPPASGRAAAASTARAPP
jgi:hypothetical protein